MIHVAAGAIIRDGSIFIALRSSEKHQGGLWEFPGGKCEMYELPDAALIRELKEEVGIDVISLQSVFSVDHDYGDKKVCLHFFVVDQFSGEPHGAEGQKVQWVSIKKLINYSFPKANEGFVAFLSGLYDLKE